MSRHALAWFAVIWLAASIALLALWAVVRRLTRRNDERDLVTDPREFRRRATDRIEHQHSRKP